MRLFAYYSMTSQIFLKAKLIKEAVYMSYTKMWKSLCNNISLTLDYKPGPIV